MTASLSSDSAPSGSKAMRLTVRGEYFIGKNLPESPIFNSVHQIQISRRSGARLLLRRSMCSLMCSLMSIESHVFPFR
jgi:hypothetical protein